MAAKAWRLPSRAVVRRPDLRAQAQFENNEPAPARPDRALDPQRSWDIHAGRDDADFLEALRPIPDAARHFQRGELEKLCSLEFPFKQLNARFKKLGL